MKKFLSICGTGSFITVQKRLLPVPALNLLHFLPFYFLDVQFSIYADVFRGAFFLQVLQ
jgi:hypothetical protein